MCNYVIMSRSKFDNIYETFKQEVHNVLSMCHVPLPLTVLFNQLRETMKTTNQDIKLHASPDTIKFLMTSIAVSSMMTAHPDLTLTQADTVIDGHHQELIRKNTDYGDSHREFGVIGVIVRMFDKFHRWETLSRQTALVKSENINDTLNDMFNYCVLAIHNIQSILIEFEPIPTEGWFVLKKSKCSFCDKLADLFATHKIEGHVRLTDHLLSNSAHREALLEWIETSIGRPYKTFPMVWFNGHFVGGYTDTLAMLGGPGPHTSVNKDTPRDVDQRGVTTVPIFKGTIHDFEHDF